MKTELGILIAEALSVYVLVLFAHSLRRRFGLAHFYALMGGLTAIMSWVTDAGVSVQVGGITFMVGSTVFYTSLLLGVFVVYVFDGPHATRIAISTVAGVSAMTPVIVLVLRFQMQIAGDVSMGYVPVPSLRINIVSVLTTIADLVFLAIAWEYLGKTNLKIRLWLRSFLTLLGVMWLDVLLFATGAFIGTDQYLNIMSGTLITRLIIAVCAFPLLYLYIWWQNHQMGMVIEKRPILAILSEFTEMRLELSMARREIERRVQIQREKEGLIDELQHALAEVKTLRGFLPICACCKKIRDDQGYWQRLEKYIQERSEARFSHGICPECRNQMYPGRDQGESE